VNVLVVDIGGTNVKVAVSGSDERRKFKSAPALTPEQLVSEVLETTADWRFDAVSIGYPGAVNADGPSAEPGNLGNGWVDFDFAAAFGRPVRVANDAVLQALGSYEGGRMLFLGLGTGLGSAFVAEHVVVPLELGNLAWCEGRSLGDTVGRKGRKALGTDVWLSHVRNMASVLRAAFSADYVLLGGGNADRVDPLPACTRRGGNHDAVTGGFRLWEETIEPHDRDPALVWRVVA
jgi:polyphosphate glucokinase